MSPDISWLHGGFFIPAGHEIKSEYDVF